MNGPSGGAFRLIVGLVSPLRLERPGPLPVLATVIRSQDQTADIFPGRKGVES